MKREVPIRCLILVIALLLMVSATAALAQGMQRGRGMRHGAMGSHMGTMSMLSQHPLSTDQQQRIATIRQQTQAKVQSIRSDTTLSVQERTSRIDEAQVAGHAEVTSVLTPDQIKEFQSWWSTRTAGMGRGARMGGRGAMSGRGPMSDVPGLVQNPLTDDQRTRIAAIRQRTQSQVSSITRNANLSADEKWKQISDARRQGHDDILDVLTQAQKQEFLDKWQTPKGSQ